MPRSGQRQPSTSGPFGGSGCSQYSPTHFSAVGSERSSTSSSAVVGCNAKVRSKSAFVAPIVTAIATLWTISAASGPTM